jgi:hypothetical protein
MKRRDFSRSVIAAMFAAPLAMLADDDHRKRYYDRDRKDYHEWNEGEDRAYRFWQESRRHAYIAWERASGADQRAYWRWRHDHPGNDWDRHDRR